MDENSSMSVHNNIYISDSYGKHEGAAIISLPNMSDANSGKKKRKQNKSKDLSSKIKLNENKLNISTESKLNNIQEEALVPLNKEPQSNNTSNIKVAIRLRPIHQKEIDDGQFEIVQIVDQKVISIN